MHPMLEICGEAANARVARQLCVEQRPDLIVLDLIIPNGDGIELLREFPRLSPAVRSIVISSCCDPLSVQRSFRAGAYGYVAKQEDPTELLAALDQVLSGEHFVSTRIAQMLVDHGKDPVIERVKSLSDRELHIFRRLGKKQGPTQIASELSLSVKTIETYQRRIIEKLNLSDGQHLHRVAEQWFRGAGKIGN
jgi:DNA-binding NarL/FixJ family response regulator